jgi:hypothetical protein
LKVHSSCRKMQRSHGLWFLEVQCTLTREH